MSQEGPDKGIDIVAFRDELGLHPPIIRVQVRSGEGNVESPEVQALAGAIGDKGARLFVALASFSKQARDYGDALLDLLLEHYEDLDARYRAENPTQACLHPGAGGGTGWGVRSGRAPAPGTAAVSWQMARNAAESL